MFCLSLSGIILRQAPWQSLVALAAFPIGLIVLANVTGSFHTFQENTYGNVFLTVRLLLMKMKGELLVKALLFTDEEGKTM